MKFLRYVYVVLALLICGIGSLRAQVLEKQWQLLARFPHRVYTVHFLDLPGPPRVGFVGSDSMVYRTSDGGQTWQPTVTNDDAFTATDFAFRDSLVGWFSNGLHLTPASCFRTTDGGLTWKSVFAPAKFCSSVYYLPHDSLLMLSGSDYTPANAVFCTSADGGQTWTTSYPGRNLNGYAFLNDSIGLVTMKEQKYLRTLNGGLTWNEVSVSGNEAWQPLADTIRHAFWVASELGSGPGAGNHQQLFRSLDFGDNFDAGFLAGYHIPTITGTIRQGSCDTLYMQASEPSVDSMKGMLVSPDGLTWRSLNDRAGSNGPANDLDTRFEVKGTYVFVGGRMAGTRDSGIWRYIGDSTKYNGDFFSRPVTSTHDLHVVTTSCYNLDTEIYVIYVNDCIAADLISAHFEPSDKFAVIPRDALPHPISGNYPLIIQHQPKSQLHDTALLILHEFVSGVDSYDTIRVTGEAIPDPKTVAVEVLLNGGKSVTTKPGDTVIATIRLVNAVPGLLGLDSILAVTSFDGNMMDEFTYNILPPWSLLHESHASGIESLAVRHTHGQDLQANSDIAQILYTTYLSPNTTGSYAFDKIQFNDSVLAGCIQATALLTPATITISTCGDTTIRGFMDGLPLASMMGILKIEGLYTLKISTGSPTPLNIRIFNILGEEVRSMQATSRGDGQQLIPLDTRGLPNGSYWVSLSAPSSPSMNTHFFLAQ